MNHRSTSPPASPHPRQRLAAAIGAGLQAWLIFALCLPPGVSWAGPRGESFVHGTEADSVTRSGDHTAVDTFGAKTIIEWRSFDIQQHESVHFEQHAGDDSRVLNRAMGLSPTSIDGRLTSNAEIYIVNEAGVYFGETAVVDVARLVAVAGQLNNEDFLAGNDHFTELRGDIVNQGEIHATLVDLIGRHVQNTGDIIAEDGSIVMLAGEEVWITRVNSHVAIKLNAIESFDRLAGVENSGTLDAGRGSVRLAAADMIGLAIRNTGRVRAHQIALEGGEDSLIDVSGELDASSEAAQGGEIELRGELIAVRDADIDASGATGGGRIVVGGDVNAGDEGRIARGVVIDAKSRIAADATDVGDGGRLTVWGTETARVHGQLSARGGAHGGDGGFVETSGLRFMELPVAPDVSAVNGVAGTWLIDPADVEIRDADSQNINPRDTELALPEGISLERTFIPTADSAILSTEAVEDALKQKSTVRITTALVGGGGNAKGNITLHDDIVVEDSAGEVVEGSVSRLVMLAANDIVLEGSIRNEVDGLILEVQLVANDSGQEELSSSNADVGKVVLEDGATIETGGGLISASGVQVDIQGDLVTKGGPVGLFAGDPSRPPDSSVDHAVTLGGSIDTQTDSSAGSIFVRSQGRVSMDETAVIDAGSTVIGAGGFVEIVGANVSIHGPITTTSADIDVNTPGLALEATAGDLRVEIQDTGGLLHTNGSIRLGARANPDGDDGGSIVLAGRAETEAPLVVDPNGIRGEVQLVADRAITVGSATIPETVLRGDRVVMLSGLLAEGGDIVFAAGSEIGANLIDIRAGLPFDAAAPGAEADLASIVASEVHLYAPGDATALPEQVILFQDATVDGTGLPELSDRPDGVAGLDYNIGSRRGDIDLSSTVAVARVAGAQLTLVTGTVTEMDGTRPGRVTMGDLTAPDDNLETFSWLSTTDLVAEAGLNGVRASAPLDAETASGLPENQITLRAGIDPCELGLCEQLEGGGVGDLVFEDGVVLTADSIKLQAGDGAGGASDAATVKPREAVDEDGMVIVDEMGMPIGAPMFQGTGAAGTPPSRFTIQQDAAVGDETIPAAAQLNLPVDGRDIDYTLQSDTALVSFTDDRRADIEGVRLRLSSPIGISIPEALKLDDFTWQAPNSLVVTDEIEHVLSDKITLQAATAGGGVLSFGVRPPVEGEDPSLLVRADEIEVLAQTLSGPAGSGSVETRSNSPRFLANLDEVNPGDESAPSQLTIGQDLDITGGELPLPSQIGPEDDTSLDGLSYTLRSQSSVSLDDPSLVVDSDLTIESDGPIVLTGIVDATTPEGTSATPDSIVAAAPTLSLVSRPDESLEIQTHLEVYAEVVGLTAALDPDTAEVPAMLPEVIADPANNDDPAPQLRVRFYGRDAYEPGEVLPPGEATNPALFAIEQVGQLDGGNLPARDQFGAGSPAEMDEIVIFDLVSSGDLSGTDDINIDLTTETATKLDGTDVQLSVTSDHGTIRFGADGSAFTYRSLDAGVMGDFTLEAGTEIQAVDFVQLEAGNSGDGTLGFGTGVVLRTTGADGTVSLRAGVDAPETGVANVNAKDGAPTFQTRNFAILQDDTIRDYDIEIDPDVPDDVVPAPGVPDADQFEDPQSVLPNGTGVLDTYGLRSLRGDVDIHQAERLAGTAMSSPGLIELIGQEVTYASESENVVFYDTVTLSGEVVTVRAQAVHAAGESGALEIQGAADNLEVRGLSGVALRPLQFSFVQDASIEGADLPQSTNFLPDPDGGLGAMQYIVLSQHGTLEGGRQVGITADEVFANRVPNTQLFLFTGGSEPLSDGETAEVEGGDVVLAARDISLRSLAVDLSTMTEGSAEPVIRFRGGVGGELEVETSTSQVYTGEVVLEAASTTLDAGGEIRLERDVVPEAGRHGQKSLTLLGDIEVGGDVGRDDNRLAAFALNPEQETGGQREGSVRFGSVHTDGDNEIYATESVSLNGGGRNSIPQVATLYKRDGDLKIVVGDGNPTTEGFVEMGVNEKLSVVGNIEIVAEDRATLSDISALGKLSVQVPNGSIEIIRRRAGNLLTADGSLVDDTGVKFTADEIEFAFDRSQSLSSQLVGSGADPIFAVTNPVSAPIYLDQFPVQGYRGDGSAPQVADFFRGDVVLDQRGEGAGTTSLEEALIDAIPKPLRRIPARNQVALDDPLGEIAIEAVPDSAEEARARTSGAIVHDDLMLEQPPNLARVSRLRLIPEETDAAIEHLEKVFGPREGRVERIKTILSEALDDYQRATGARRVIGFEFRRFLRNRPNSQFVAYRTLEELAALFEHHSRSGLVASEYRRVQEQWLALIKPEGITVNELSEAILPSRYVRGSDILDVFGK